VSAILQRAGSSPGRKVTFWFRHLGVFGLFLLAILDSSPIPTFGGPDILLAILAASHRNPWFVYAGAAAAGSLIGAFITFRIARKAGSSYTQKMSKRGTVRGMLRLFRERGTGTLIASAAVPFPFPTSVFFAAAGASRYKTVKYLIVVAVSRAARYTLIALVADHYGRHFIRVLRHPTQYWGWLLLFVFVIVALIAGGVLVSRRFATSPAG